MATIFSWWSRCVRSNPGAIMKSNSTTKARWSRMQATRFTLSVRAAPGIPIPTCSLRATTSGSGTPRASIWLLPVTWSRTKPKASGASPGALLKRPSASPVLIWASTSARALDAQIKSGEADGRFSNAPGDAPLAFGFVRDHVTGSNQIEALGVPEPEVVASKLHVGIGIPGAARTDKVNLVACILDHRAFVVEFDFMIAPGFERTQRDHQEKIVAIIANQIGAQRF